MAKLVKVLLAERHQPIKEVITTEISGLKNVSLIGCVQTGEDLESFLNTTSEYPDVILLDADIDIEDHFHYTRLITDKYPGISIIVLADGDESLYIRRMMKNGADGYVNRESCNEGLKDLLQERDTVATTQINFLYTKATDDLDRLTKRSILDKKEKNVLKMLMNQYSSMEISEELSMKSGEIHKTIDRLNEKTNSSNSLELKRYALRHSIF